MLGLTLLAVALGTLVGAAVSHGAEAIVAERRLGVPRCPYCQAPYALGQWSAIVAVLTGGVRCRQCRRPLRLPRLIGELYIAAGWGLAVGLYGLNLKVLLFLLALLPLGMVMVTDLMARRVPNTIVLPSIAGMLVLGSLLGPAVPALVASRWWVSLAGAALGFLVLRAFVWLGETLFGEGAMGGGDVTLSTYAGAALGFPLIVPALLIAVLLGGVGALAVLVARKGNLRTAIPYGPYIILGATLTMLWGPAILVWYFR